MPQLIRAFSLSGTLVFGVILTVIMDLDKRSQLLPLPALLRMGVGEGWAQPPFRQRPPACHPVTGEPGSRGAWPPG